MISKNQIKYISSLQKKKYRDENQSFIAEGPKIILELLNSDLLIEFLFATEEFYNDNKAYLQHVENKLEIISKKELQKISYLKTPNLALAIVKYPQVIIDETEILSKVSLALDTIQDPGNFGTIIRLADWFGINYIFCSHNTVDLYNPKVIQSTMGSFIRTKIIYTDLELFLKSIYKISDFTIYGAALNKTNLYNTKLTNKGIIVMGNESNGISENIKKYINQFISIPSYGKSQTESLNVAIATAIICAEFKKNSKTE